MSEALNIVNGVFHLVVAAVLLGGIAVAVKDTQELAKKSDVNTSLKNKAVFSTTMMLSSLLCVTIIFSIVSIIILFKSRKRDIYDEHNSFSAMYIASNFIIMAFSITVLLPIIVAIADVGTGEMVGVLLGGNLLAFIVSAVIISVYFWRRSVEPSPKEHHDNVVHHINQSDGHTKSVVKSVVKRMANDHANKKQDEEELAKIDPKHNLKSRKNNKNVESTL